MEVVAVPTLTPGDGTLLCVVWLGFARDARHHQLVLQRCRHPTRLKTDSELAKEVRILAAGRTWQMAHVSFSMSAPRKCKWLQKLPATYRTTRMRQRSWEPRERE